MGVSDENLIEAEETVAIPLTTSNQALVITIKRKKGKSGAQSQTGAGQGEILHLMRATPSQAGSDSGRLR